MYTERFISTVVSNCIDLSVNLSRFIPLLLVSLIICSVDGDYSVAAINQADRNSLFLRVAREPGFNVVELCNDCR